jgi:hypothetical protein
MTDTTSVPSAPQEGVFRKAVSAIQGLGHDVAHAEEIVAKLLSSGIVLRDVNAADHDVHEVQQVVDEAAPVLEAAEPVLAPEVKDVETVTDDVAKDADKGDVDAQNFINNDALPTSPAPVRNP